MDQSVASINCNSEKENNPIFREERLNVLFREERFMFYLCSTLTKKKSEGNRYASTILRTTSQ